jgi:deoxycytidylate deaminase
MIRHTLVMSLLLVSTQAIATTPCPTCKKGYVASSLEEVLIAQQKAKGSDLKKTPKGSSIPGKAGDINPIKTPVKNNRKPNG